MSKKCMPLWCDIRKAKRKNTPGSDHFGRCSVVFSCRGNGFCTFTKASLTRGFCNMFKNNGTRGTFEEPLQRCTLCRRRRVRDIFIMYGRRSGHRFPERGCILENQILRFLWTIVRDKCNTSCDLALLFLGRRGTLKMGCRNRKTHWHEAVRSALTSSVLKKVSQNRFICEIANFTN